MTSSSNTMILPTASTSIGVARAQINDSFLALLQNFYSGSRPASTNITYEGAGFSPPNGTLWVDSTTGTLYKADSVFGKNATLAPFSRYGIGYRIEPSLNSANTNQSSYEVGELISVTATGIAQADARLYMKFSNSSPHFIDVGVPPTGSITSTMIADQSITTNKLANNSISTPKIIDANITDPKLATGGTIKYDTSGRLTVGNSTLNSNSQFVVYNSYNTAYANVASQTLTISSGNTTWDTFLGPVATLTLSSNCNVAVSNMRVGTYILHVLQSASGSNTISWSSSFKWVGGFAPVLTTAASARDVFSFVSDGTNMYGTMLPDVK